MLTLTVISSVLTIAFFAVIVVLVWYVRHMFKSIVYLNENHKDLLVMLQHYSDHVKSVHEMEMFYGDETLKSLISHSRDIVHEVNQFTHMFPGIGEPSSIREDINAETEIEE